MITLHATESVAATRFPKEAKQVRFLRKGRPSCCAFLSLRSSSRRKFPAFRRKRRKRRTPFRKEAQEDALPEGREEALPLAGDALPSGEASFFGKAPEVKLPEGSETSSERASFVHQHALHSERRRSSNKPKVRSTCTLFLRKDGILSEA